VVKEFDLNLAFPSSNGFTRVGSNPARSGSFCPIAQANLCLKLGGSKVIGFIFARLFFALLVLFFALLDSSSFAIQDNADLRVLSALLRTYPFL
jgi:hypothetical protein